MTNPNTEQKTDIAKTLGIDEAGSRMPRLRRWLIRSVPVAAVSVVGDALTYAEQDRR
jgi:hypothetical protein